MYPMCSFLHGRPSHVQNSTAFPHMMSGLTGGVLIVRSARTKLFNELLSKLYAELVFAFGFKSSSTKFPNLLKNKKIRTI